MHFAILPLVPHQHCPEGEVSMRTVPIPVSQQLSLGSVLLNTTSLGLSVLTQLCISQYLVHNRYTKNGFQIDSKTRTFLVFSVIGSLCPLSFSVIR